jgi:branched-subunit amino acid transport protein
MSAMIVAVAALVLMNFAFKAVGPALLGDRHFPERVQAVIDVLPPALLGALLVVDLLGSGWKGADWTLCPGICLAVGLRACGRSHLLCIAAGIAVTVATRSLTS